MKIPTLMKNLYKPQPLPANFTVQFRDGDAGLERVVDLAISGRDGEFILAEQPLAKPLYSVEVLLKSGKRNDFLEPTREEVANHIRDNRLSYKLTAEVTSAKNGSVALREEDFTEDFRVTRVKVDWTNVRSLKLWAPHTHLSDISLLGEKIGPGKLFLSQVVTYGNSLTRFKVTENMRAYATALETCVRSAYRNAREPVPQQTLYLDAGPAREVIRPPVQKQEGVK